MDLRSDAQGFAEACREVLLHPRPDRDRKVAPILHDSRWDTIAQRMEALMDRRAEDLRVELDPRAMTPMGRASRGRTRASG